MRRRRVTYRPSKSQAVFGGVVGIIFVCIAAGITGMNFYQAFGRGYVGPEIHIEDENGEKSGGLEERLRQLQTLYEQGLITQEEYDQKRRAILEDL